MAQRWFCYMVRCCEGSLYVGIATDLVEREKEHNWGVGAAFTAKRRPVKIVWWEERKDQDDAHRREIEIKGWSRKKKLKLIEEFEKKQKAGERVNPSLAFGEAQGKGE